MRVLIGTLLLTALVPAATATYPLCGDVTEAPPNPAGLYALLDPLDPFAGSQFWLETNQEPGLQRVACQQGDGSIILPDTRLLDVSA